jgi:hypothetical protein
MTVDFNALNAHAAALKATSDRLSRIQHDLAEVEQAIRPDPVNSGFGAFPAATDAYTGFATVVNALYGVLGAAVADVQKVIEANGTIAKRLQAAEQATVNSLQASGLGA